MATINICNRFGDIENTIEIKLGYNERMVLVKDNYIEIDGENYLIIFVKSVFEENSLTNIIIKVIPDEMGKYI